MTEHWLGENVFCPQCGASTIDHYANNRQVADFFCRACNEDFELKSKRGAHGRKIPDGAYSAMINRIGSAQNPNFLLLSYERNRMEVTDLDIIPKHYFVPSIIEKRPPLGPHARRAGWVGCNIVIDGIPKTGRISIISGGRPTPKSDVLRAWNRTLFLREQPEPTSRGWLMDIMRCIERLNKVSFTLAELYGCSEELEKLHPDNRNVHAKIRQQLQVLRDASYLDFEARGFYRLRG